MPDSTPFSFTSSLTAISSLAMPSNNEQFPNPSAQLDQKMLEDAFSKAIAGFFSSSKSVGTDARTEFFQLYKRESEELDKEFIKKYDEDANTTLIFAGLFSAVTSAFLIDAQKNLQQDYAQVSANLLQILIYKVNNSTFSSADFPLPAWNGPTPTMVNVQCLLYTSLAASLIAAFGAMLGKQWINRYSRTDNRGSLMDRSRDRQRKFDGMTRWHFDWVMESLPLILQVALLLLGLALSLSVWTIFKRVGTVLLFFTSLGVAFYVIIIICGTLWYDCPFQTPATTFIRALFEYDNNHSRYTLAIYKGLHYLVEKCSSMITRAGNRFRRLVRADEEAAPETELMEMQKDRTPLFTEEKDINWNRHIADARCICWMWETSTDDDVAIATARFIPEVEWHSDIVAMPSLDKLWDGFVSCYIPASLSDRMFSETMDKAYFTLKALVHLYAQRRCVDDIPISDGDALFPYYNHLTLKPDGQILSTLMLLGGLMDKRFYSLGDKVSVVSVQHLSWMLHIIVYTLLKDESVHGDIDIHRFIRKVLECYDRPSILTDCFLVIGLTIGIPMHINDSVVVDKSTVLDDVARMLFKQIKFRFEHCVSPEYLDLDWTMETLETLAYCQNPPLCVSVVYYDLCHTILESTIVEGIKWKAFQLVMQIGFRRSTSAIPVDDYEWWPVTGLNFLEHQFALEHPEESAYDTIADVFSALSNVDPKDDMHLTKSFLSGMIASLQIDRPARLKPQIIRFIRHFRKQIFDAGVEGMSEEERRIFFSAISSEVDVQGEKYYCRDMLIHALRSPVWRPYLSLKHLELLESLVSSIGPGPIVAVFDASYETRLIHELADEDLLNGSILKTWVQVLWLDLHIDMTHLEVRRQAQSAIRKLFTKRPELVDEFRMAINLWTQNEHYRRYPDEMQQARDELEEVGKHVTFTINSPEHAELHATSTSSG